MLFLIPSCPGSWWLIIPNNSQDADGIHVYDVFKVDKNKQKEKVQFSDHHISQEHLLMIHHLEYVNFCLELYSKWSLFLIWRLKRPRQHIWVAMALRNITKPKALDDYDSLWDLWHPIPPLSPRNCFGFCYKKDGWSLLPKQDIFTLVEQSLYFYFLSIYFCKWTLP